MSSSVFAPIAVWEYRDIASPPASLHPEPTLAELAEQAAMPPLRYTEDDLLARVKIVLAEAQAAHARQAEHEEQQRKAELARVLDQFESQRAAYFKKVEAEVVQLALAIARKILEREAALDPTLLTGLVRIALDRMHAEPPVRVRVGSADFPGWQRALASGTMALEVDLAEDESLRPGDCLVETRVGSANFGFEAQLQEIERSFLDLLQKRPGPEA